MKREYLMTLIKELKNIQVYIDGENFGVYKYDFKNKRYQGVIGYLEIESVIRCINGDAELNFIEIREV